LQTLYMFKASGLQTFIFSSNRLKDVVGASQCIELLTGEYLDVVLDEMGLTPSDFRVIQRAAGSATLLFEDVAHARQLQRIWPLICHMAAPELGITQWSGEVSGGLFDALRQGWAALRSRRNVPAITLPELAPPALRSPRTGQGVTRIENRGGGQKELLDASIVRRRRVSSEHDHVNPSISPGDVHDAWDGVPWTLDTLDLARGERSYLSVVHADGNRLGQFLILLSEVASAIEDDGRTIELYQQFSSGLSSATARALVTALKAHGTATVNDAVPIRPVILGGDDVTFLIESSEAVAVTRRFLEAFENETRAFMRTLASEFPELSARIGKRTHLTACAGIVFQRPRQPLIAGAELSEKLCRFAKRQSRRDGEDMTLSSLMFSRLLDSANADFETRSAAEFVDPDSNLRLTRGPYTIDTRRDSVSLEDLSHVLSALGRQGVAKGGIRRVVDLLHQDRERAEIAMERLVDVSGQDGDTLKRTLEQVHGMRGGVLERGAHELSILPDAAILSSMNARVSHHRSEGGEP
jgi:hypothetical protein